MKKIYKIGFTRPALLRESVLVAQIFRESIDWKETKQKISEMHLLQTRTDRSEKILFDEIKGRLESLNREQIELLADDYPSDVNQINWIMICKQYSFVSDFVLEVISPAVLAGRRAIDYVDYAYFFNSKAESHPELDAISEKTKSNARGALFQMMRQCDLLGDENNLLPQMVTKNLQSCTPASELAFLPGAILL